MNVNEHDKRAHLLAKGDSSVERRRPAFAQGKKKKEKKRKESTA